MATNVTFNGQIFSIPAEGDSGWGPALTNLFIALSTGALQKTGGSFTLGSEVDFGAAFGVKGLYFKSRNANPAGSGVIRLGNGEALAWRNADNNADLSLRVDSGNNLNFNGTSLSVGGTPVQANVTVSDTLTIQMTKTVDDISAVVRALSISNAHIATTAAIAYSKLNLAGSILNADVAAGAAIALSKLAAVTVSRVLVSDGAGVIAPSSVTSTELALLAGKTSLVTLAGAETLSNKTLTNPVISAFADISETTTPANPAAGFVRLYPKADGQVYTKNSAGVESRLGAGGGGGGSLQWVEADLSPVAAIENLMQVYLFGDGLDQSLYTTVRVPAGYVAGSPVTMKVLGYSPDSTFNALILSQSTLLSIGVAGAGSAIDQRTSTNAAVAIVATDRLVNFTLDLSSSTGQINGTAIAPGDLIKVRIYRGTDTSTSDLRVLPFTAEVSFA